MGRFLFASTAFPAHLDWGGCLETATRLRQGGHEVLWATGPSVASFVERAGIRTRSVPVVDPYRGGPAGIERLGADHDRTEMVDVWRAAFRGLPARDVISPRLARYYAFQIRLLVDCWLQEGPLSACAKAVLDVIDGWRPDVVVAEPLMLPAALAAETRGLRFASCGFPGAMLVLQSLVELEATASEIVDTLNRVRRGLGLNDVTSRADVELFFVGRDLQLVYFPPTWFGTLRAQPAPTVEYVGASPLHRGSIAPARSEGRTIVMAVASSYMPAAGVLHAMFDAVGRVGACGVIGGDSTLRELAGCLPPHIRWEPWLRYDEVLPTASVMLHHGGLGTTHCAVRAGIPQIVLPGFLDQCLHAEAIERAGAGLMHVGPITSSTLADLLHRTLHEKTFRLAAHDLKDAFDAHGGTDRAAALLVSLAQQAH